MKRLCRVSPTVNFGKGFTEAPVWRGDWYQFSVAALIPLNRASGPNVGAIAQLHIFFDDLLPGSLGKPLLDW